MTRENMEWVYDAILSTPAMDESVRKLVLSPSRKLVLILSQVIDQAMERKKGEGSDLLSFFPEEAEALKKLKEELLEQADITSLASKLRAIPK